MRKLVRSFTLSSHTHSVTLSFITRGAEMLAIMKYMNGGNTGIFNKNSVSSTHPHENSGATGVYHNKGKLSYEFHERRTGAGVYVVRRNL